MTRPRKLKLLALAQSLAEERATEWRVYTTDSRGNKLAGWRIVKAQSRERAVRKVRRSTGADPILKSSEWRAVYAEVGL